MKIGSRSSRTLLMSVGIFGSTLVAAMAFAASSRCDMNGDNKITIADIQIVSNQAQGKKPCTTGDLNNDGVCDKRDVQIVIQAALTGNCAAAPSSTSAPKSK